MPTKFLLLSLACLFISQIHGQKKVPNPEVDFRVELKNMSIRAIEVVNDSTLWFAGSNGRYGRIINERLEIDSLSHEGRNPSFRSIAYNGQAVFILSIENPALIYKIDPNNNPWEPQIVYSESHSKVFYDSMKFFNEQKGIAMGDPVEDCLSVLITEDAGNHWKKLSCEQLPTAFEGEAAFAASNTNISVVENCAWIATGGTKARVFKSSDFGNSWNVSESPIVQGGKMTGIFTMDFYDKKTGIIMGGNWEAKSNQSKTKAMSHDGGKSWTLMANESAPGYISCVQFIPNKKGKEIMAVSTEGLYFSGDKGKNWAKIGDEGFYSLKMIDDKSVWLAGHEKIVKIKLIENENE